MAELQRQAATQAQMAAEQQRRIQEMMALQQQTNDQLAAMKRQDEERKQAAAMAATNRDKDLAEQARQALGRYGELGERAKELDRNNRDLYTQMAQIQQRSQLLEDQNYLLRQRLKETSDQLASAMQSGQVAEQRLQAVQASTVRRGGATITANSSLKRYLTAVTVPGLNIRQDGELVRIELPADQLFENGTATLRPGSEAQLDQVAQVVIEHYSRQVIGIEAHTDGLPPAGTSFRNPHQLTAAQAMAVFDHMGERHRTLAEQLFVLGHGANYPVASNATSAGQQRNRRVEIVIYPEPVGSR
jgi:flagellar motor protein MotB